MKYTLLIAAVFSFITAQAQLAPFPRPGLEYGSIYICNPFDCPTYVNNSMRYAGDTLLCGETWHNFQILPNLSGSIFIRQNSGKYYQLGNCDNQLLLYDFSKEVGDTILTSDLGALRVIETGIFSLATGEERKKMVVERIENPLFQDVFTWVDGIGDLDRGFLRPADFEGGYGELICVKDSTGLLFQQTNPTFQVSCDSILCPWPQPAFDYTCSGMTFYFTNLSDRADSYTWDFGDGQTSTATNPVHTYSAPGCYSVRLKAKSECLPQEYLAAKILAVNAPLFWQKISAEMPEPFKKMQFLDTLRGWALSDQKIWKTIDGGSHWEAVPYPGLTRPPADLHFSDFEHGIIQMYKPGPPYYYSEILWTDNGSDWQTHQFGSNNQPSITAIERIDDNTAMVASRFEGIYLTQNGGQNWNLIQLPWPPATISDFERLTGDTICYVGTSSFPLGNTSTVLGKTVNLTQWTTQEFQDISYGEKLSFIGAQEGWMSNKLSVYHTTNGGASWTKQLSAGITEIDFVDALNGWASGYSGIFGTTDGGITWTAEACSRAGEYIRGLNGFAPGQAYIVFDNGLHTYRSIPDTIKLCQTSMVSESSTTRKKLLAVFPNPASNDIMIQWAGEIPQAAKVVLCNLQGVKIRHWDLPLSGTVSVMGIPPGLYFVGIYSSTGALIDQVEKLVIVGSD